MKFLERWSVPLMLVILLAQYAVFIGKEVSTARLGVDDASLNNPGMLKYLDRYPPLQLDAKQKEVIRKQGELDGIILKILTFLTPEQVAYIRSKIATNFIIKPLIEMPGDAELHFFMARLLLQRKVSGERNLPAPFTMEMLPSHPVNPRDRLSSTQVMDGIILLETSGTLAMTPEQAVKILALLDANEGAIGKQMTGPVLRKDQKEFLLYCRDFFMYKPQMRRGGPPGQSGSPGPPPPNSSEK